MKQLSGMDNLFLALEHEKQYMHVCCLGIYDPSTAPGGKVRFKAILQFFSERLNIAKTFRRRLVGAPFGLDRPYWVEDGEIDIEYHVRHIALPAPGDWRQLMIQVARIHSRPLDRAKPLWEAYIIEGLDNIAGIPLGSFALLLKVHHAAVDGEAGAELLRSIHSLSLDEQPSNGGKVPMQDRPPTSVELYARAVGNRAQQAFDASKLIVSLGSQAATLAQQFIASTKSPEAGGFSPAKQPDPVDEAPTATRKTGKPTGLKPHTRFDVPLSAHRVVDSVGFPMADIKTIRRHVPQVTFNEIFMSVVGGALRKYLAQKDELPIKTLSAMVPMSARGEIKDMDSGNQIGFTPMQLRTDVKDPMERLLAVRKSSTKSKAISSMMGRDLPGKLIQVLPAVAAKRLLRHGLIETANIMVSNVRGPDVPMYVAGARLQLFVPISVPFDGMGLNITGFSYNGTLWACFASCRNMLPDPATMVDCLNESFQETLAAAKALPESPVLRAPKEKRVQPIRTADVAVKKKRSPAPRKAKPRVVDDPAEEKRTPLPRKAKPRVVKAARVP